MYFKNYILEAENFLEALDHSTDRDLGDSSNFMVLKVWFLD